jgi:peptidoglycan lytic transglycosylase B
MTRARLRACLLASLVVAAPGVTTSQTPPAAPPDGFVAFLADVRAEALARGIKEATLARTIDGLTAEPVVVARDRNQPELVQSLDAYVAGRLTRRTIATARDMAVVHRAVLTRVEAQFGVSRSMMVAIWGLESNFGRFTGTYPTIQALATLAYDNRRPLFRDELLSALTMVDRGLVLPDDMRGSWAGAMGQPQFMPSNFLKYAVDFDRDGVIDIWESPADVFASMARYLQHAGWTRGERWGREVTASHGVLSAIDRAVPMRTTGCRAVRAMTEARPLRDWEQLGVRLSGGRRLPTSTMTASFVRGTRRHFLVYGNYEALLDYNCSHAYAIAAGLLSDVIQ